jgi:hypothetical protein
LQLTAEVISYQLGMQINYADYCNWLFVFTKLLVNHRSELLAPYGTFLADLPIIANETFCNNIIKILKGEF